MTELDLGAPPRRGGRPTREDAAALCDRIVAVATDLFLGQGFGATSIEAVAGAAGVSKRTFYHRFRDKPDLFRAVVRRLIARWATPYEAELAVVAEQAEPIEETLLKAARRILAATLSPEALQLYRLLIAEAPRFPELALIINEQSASAGQRLGQYLAGEARAGRLALDDPAFAAEQLINMVLAGPRRRALGLGPAMKPAELDRWLRRSVALFLKGCGA